MNFEVLSVCSNNVLEQVVDMESTFRTVSVAAALLKAAYFSTSTAKRERSLDPNKCPRCVDHLYLSQVVSTGRIRQRSTHGTVAITSRLTQKTHRGQS
jgi:hypothetical protein